MNSNLPVEINMREGDEQCGKTTQRSVSSKLSAIGREAEHGHRLHSTATSRYSHGHTCPLIHGKYCFHFFDRFSSIFVLSMSLGVLNTPECGKISNMKPSACVAFKYQWVREVRERYPEHTRVTSNHPTTATTKNGMNVCPTQNIMFYQDENKNYAPCEEVRRIWKQSKNCCQVVLIILRMPATENETT